MSARGARIGAVLAFLAALAVGAPSAGDIGLTWDEPAYRYSQLMSEPWWEQAANVRSRADLEAALDPDTLLYHWDYGRFGINFHPPLAGQINLLSYQLLGGWLNDYPARRMATVVELALAAAIVFGAVARPYGAWAGAIAAGSLVMMPRVYGQAHLVDTDTPGLLIWTAAAAAFWRGLRDEQAGGARAAVGLLVGLAFVEKMAAVLVVLPLVGWLVVARLPAALRRGTRADWIDGLVTTILLLIPSIVAFREVRRLATLLPPPNQTDLFVDRPESPLPGLILAAPLALWLIRRLIGRLWPRSTLWGTRRPALEIWAALLAWPPAVAWLGNPAWWRETLPRLAHYYMLNTDRENALPDIRIFYLGETYLYSLPWHSGWVLIAVTVPAAILVAGVVGIGYVLGVVKRDRLPLFWLVNFATLPAMRLLPTPAHDGVRLLLPAFAFLAALAGLGAVRTADGLAAVFRRPAWSGRLRAVAALIVLGPSAWALATVHPFELSYYNAIVDGPRGASRLGFERTYWYDAFDPIMLGAVNDRLPEGAAVGFSSALAQPMTFADLQSLGALRPDLKLGAGPNEPFPHMWLLTHDSKAEPFTRLLYAMTPAVERRPGQLVGLRVASVVGPEGVSRAWALNLMANASDGRSTTERGRSPLPAWAAGAAPWLGRFWGDGLVLAPRPSADRDLINWARRDPDTLRAAAREVAAGGSPTTADGRRLRAIMTRDGSPAFEQALATLARWRPEAIVEAAAILTDQTDGVVAQLLSPGFNDPELVGGYLDRGMPGAAGVEVR